MQRFKEMLFTFPALCAGLIVSTIIVISLNLIPPYAYYLIWQSAFVFLLLAIALSIYFNKSKLFVLLLFPLFFNLAMAFPSTFFTKLSVSAFWHIVPLITLLGFLVVYALQERGLFSPFGAFRSLIGVLFLLLGYLALQNYTPSLQAALDAPILPPLLHGITKTGDLIVILSFIALLFIFLISLLFENQSQKAPFWMLLSLTISFLFFQESNSFVLWTLTSALIAIVALIHDAYRMAYIDTLTKIPGRRALEERFLHLGSNYTIAMVDIDFFKKFNDTFGHDIGDEVLKMIAKELSHVKSGGKAYRYGGEEFTILFSRTKKEDCIMALEEVRERIFRRGFIIRDKNRPEKSPKKPVSSQNYKKEKLSISLGAAHAMKGKSPYDILKMADESLYKAKESGRNCLVYS